MPGTMTITGCPGGQSRCQGHQETSRGVTGRPGNSQEETGPRGSGPGPGSPAGGGRGPGSPAGRGRGGSDPETAGPGPDRPGRIPRAGKRRRTLGVAFIGCGLVMLPWLAVLAIGLPGHYQAAHWAAAWVGLDGMEAAGLLATGWLVLRADPWRCLAATATAVLLTVDAWFDVATAAPGQAQGVAIAMAICPELPVAALCATLAARSLPRRAPRRFDGECPGRAPASHQAPSRT